MFKLPFVRFAGFAAGFAAAFTVGGIGRLSFELVPPAKLRSGPASHAARRMDPASATSAARVNPGMRVLVATVSSSG
jgi:hypothetical protein